MPHHAFAHVTRWVFDLDNTLYAPGPELFGQVQARMTAYVMRELGLGEDAATELRQRYWRKHGTTLCGLMLHHGIAPDPFLEEVHDIDLSVVAPDPGLAALIAALPGRRYVFTNGSRRHGQRVTAALGLAHAFDAVYGIEDAGYVPKPAAEAFDRVLTAAAIAGPEAAMFEDEARHLAEPHRRGMRTVLVGSEDAGGVPHVEFASTRLDTFLARLF